MLVYEPIKSSSLYPRNQQLINQVTGCAPTNEAGIPCKWVQMPHWIRTFPSGSVKIAIENGHGVIFHSDVNVLPESITVLTGWWFGTWILFSHSVGVIHILTITNHILKPPTRLKSMKNTIGTIQFSGHIDHDHTKDKMLFLAVVTHEDFQRPSNSSCCL